MMFLVTSCNPCDCDYIRLSFETAKKDSLANFEQVSYDFMRGPHIQGLREGDDKDQEWPPANSK